MVGFVTNGNHTLRYHVCALSTDQPNALTNCTDARSGDMPIPGEGITGVAHETMMVDESVRAVSQAFAIRMKGQTSRVVVRNLAIDRVGEHLLFKEVCEIKFGSEDSEDYTFVSQVLIQNNLLLVLQPYFKTIRVFQLGDPGCLPIHNITATTLKTGYFSPQGMRVWGEGGVLLVWQWDELLALKVSGHSASDFKVRLISSNPLPFVDLYTILTDAAPYLLVLGYKASQVVKYHLDHKYKLTRLGVIGLDGSTLVPPSQGSYA